MDGCEGLTPEQIEILLKHTDNTWNQRRSTMKPPENKTPRKNRCIRTIYKKQCIYGNFRTGEVNNEIFRLHV